MKAPKPSALNFEKHARSDWKMWFTTCVGLGLLLGVWQVDTSVNGWIPAVFGVCLSVMGLGLLGIGCTALFTNASRGCRVDLDAGTFAWWQMKGAGWFSSVGEIRLDDAVEISIQSKKRQDIITVYDQKGLVLATVPPLVLPPKPKDWAGALCAACPHITLKVT